MKSLLLLLAATVRLARGQFVCDIPTNGCTNGMFNQALCGCECISPFCLDTNGDCLDLSNNCGGGNPWQECTRGVNCPWWVNPLKAQSCTTGPVVPIGNWDIYNTRESCCNVNFAYSANCDGPEGSRPTAQPTLADPEDVQFEVVPIKFDVSGLPDSIIMRVLKNEMVTVLKRILLRLSQNIPGLKISNIEELVTFNRNLEKALRALKKDVTLYFDVYVVRVEGKEFGPLIIAEIRDSYEQVLDQIQTLSETGYFGADVDLNWCTAQDGKFDLCVRELIGKPPTITPTISMEPTFIPAPVDGVEELVPPSVPQPGCESGCDVVATFPTTDTMEPTTTPAPANGVEELVPTSVPMMEPTPTTPFPNTETIDPTFTLAPADGAEELVPTGMPTMEPTPTTPFPTTETIDPTITLPPYITSTPVINQGQNEGFVCDIPSSGCTNGMFNQLMCECECISPFCPDQNGDCLDPSNNCGGNPWEQCTPGVNCPWWQDVSKAESCTTGHQVPLGLWQIYNTRQICCNTIYPYSNICGQSTTQPTITSEPTSFNSEETTPIMEPTAWPTWPGPDIFCVAPSSGCTNGMFNQAKCKCDCIVPYCPDLYGDCSDPSNDCGGNLWAQCTSDADVNCPWWVDVSKAESCTSGPDVPLGVWEIYNTKESCCKTNFAYSNICTFQIEAGIPSYYPTITRLPTMGLEADVSSTANPTRTMYPTSPAFKGPTAFPISKEPAVLTISDEISKNQTIAPAGSKESTTPTKSKKPSKRPTLSPTNTTKEPGENLNLAPIESNTEGDIYYPNFSNGLCLSDGNVPPDVSEGYLFENATECCDTYFPTNMEACLQARVPTAAPTPLGVKDWYPDYDNNICKNDGQQGPFEINFFYNREECCGFELIDTGKCLTALNVNDDDDVDDDNIQGSNSNASRYTVSTIVFLIVPSWVGIFFCF